jgi:hypothetical protein
MAILMIARSRLTAVPFIKQSGWERAVVSEYNEYYLFRTKLNLVGMKKRVILGFYWSLSSKFRSMGVTITTKTF